jgi:hypothetical protein
VINVSSWEREMAGLMEQAATEAPYKIFKQGDQYVVKNNTGLVKARFKTRAQALQYQRALYSNVPGAAKKAAKTHWTGTAPMPKKAAK